MAGFNVIIEVLVNVFHFAPSAAMMTGNEHRPNTKDSG
jgi:hypothetical protein